MSIKIRNAALVGAIAAVTASAWATHEPRGSNTSYVPKYSVVQERSVATPTESIAVTESLSPNESLVSEPIASETFVTERVVTTRQTTPIRVADRFVEQSAITVEEGRLTEDQRLQSEVMDRLAGNPRLSGKIGVESYDSVVTLSGWTYTAAQARHAERDASSVRGVKYVRNGIRARIGGSV